MVSRRIYLVRHGETEGESSIRYHGRNDVALSQVGRRQVERLVPWLHETRFAALLHSPLSRARSSADVLLAGLAHRPPVVEEHGGLTEVDFGAIEGLTDAEIAAQLPDWHRAWRADRVDGFPGGDTFAAFAARVAAAWDDVLHRHGDGDLLIVSHRGVIKRALMHALQLDRSEGNALDIHLGSLTVVLCGARVEIEKLAWLPP